jgi:hypothetical protein
MGNPTSQASPSSNHSSRISASGLIPLREIEPRESDTGASISLDEIRVMKKEASEEEEEEEKVDPDISSASPNSTPSDTVIPKQCESGSEFSVWWEEPVDQDPENPMNWSSTRKWVNILTISFISFLV